MIKFVKRKKLKGDKFMRKLAMSILFCLSIFVLASCNQNGLEKISFKEAEKNLKIQMANI